MAEAHRIDTVLLPNPALSTGERQNDQSVPTVSAQLVWFLMLLHPSPFPCAGHSSSIYAAGAKVAGKRMVFGVDGCCTPTPGVKGPGRWVRRYRKDSVGVLVDPGQAAEVEAVAGTGDGNVGEPGFGAGAVGVEMDERLQVTAGRGVGGAVLQFSPGGEAELHPGTGGPHLVCVPLHHPHPSPSGIFRTVCRPGASGLPRPCRRTARTSAHLSVPGAGVPLASAAPGLPAAGVARPGPRPGRPHLAAGRRVCGLHRDAFTRASASPRERDRRQRERHQ